MPEISYKDFDGHLETLEKSRNAQKPQVYLFHGEELLYKKAFESFLDFLIPLEDRVVNCEPVDGAPENIREAVNRANTYSMLSGNKIIAVQESRIFYGNQEKGKLLDQAKEAFQRDDRKKASKYILSLLGNLQLQLEDVVSKEDLSARIPDDGDGSDTGWILEILEFCRENGLSVPTADRPDQFLEAAIEKGFPEGNYLALTTDLVDKRRSLFKCIKEKGVAVDCSVPKGDRRADRLIQEEVLRNRTETILSASKKSLSPPAFARLYEMTGFDLRTFSNNLEKLILYIGDRSVILPEDVTAVLERSRQDPIYELTGALSDRDAALSLRLLDSLLQSGLHPLQVFAAIVNQTRKLLIAKSFIRSPQGRTWKPVMPYNVFTSQVLPGITDYDRELLSLFESWEDMLNPEDPEGGEEREKSRKKKKKTHGQKVPADLLVAANPKNPYPIYLTLKKADNFSDQELAEIYAKLGDTDMRMKRSAHDPKIVLEEIILRICNTR